MRTQEGTLYEKRTHERGFAALLIVLVVGAAALVFAVNYSLVGLGELSQSASYRHGVSARTVAEGCVDEALRRIQLDPLYTADVVLLSLPGGSCTITVTANGETRVIRSVGVVGDYARVVMATTTRSADAIAVDAWEEE